jgi:hypothetical protein
MRSRLPRTLLFLLVLGLGWYSYRQYRTASPVAPPTPGNQAARPPVTALASAGEAAAGGGGGRVEEVATPLQRFGYAHAWNGPLTPAMAAFQTWTEAYRAAPAPGRANLVAEGVSLARARRVEMRRLIVEDPARALAVTVPAAVRQVLPSEVVAELETRHAGRGDFALQAAQPAPGEPATYPALRRIVALGGQTFTAHAYGRREAQMTKEGASLHGIALEGEFALHESPVRLLEPGETAAAVRERACVECGRATEADAAGTADRVEQIELEGVIRRVHAGELNALEERARDAEDQPGPRVAPVTEAEPGRAAEPATAFTTGTKQVLVIRVDFSDFPGEPLSQAAAEATMEASKTFFENGSYGQTTFVTTVSPRVYRLPRTGASYAVAGDNTGLHNDARSAASADFTIAGFDRIIVVFPNLSASRVPGSQITYGGLGTISGTNSWINGPNSFGNPTVSHELGHNYGLLHANLWRVTDRDATSDGGTSLEYGDPFDMMGSSTTTGVARDQRHHFNMWSKNRLGWLPDSAVTTVTQSGLYRIHRFDSRTSNRELPLALRVFRDGVRWYWIGLRQSFSSGSPRADGAYVVWGYNQRLQSQLIDLTNPGTSATDAVLAIGATYTDARYGITIRPVARGGNEPEEWLDVEVTVPANPYNVVTSWGREGASFFNTETGGAASPAPETNVPAGLRGVQAIAAGDTHALALRADGTVVAWGSNTNGQSTVPSGLNEVVSIAAGGNISGVVRSDGTVQLWGDATGNATTPPPGLTGVRQLAIGGGNASRIYHALALKSDGTVVGWGDNTRGQATPPANLTNVVAIAASDRLSVALQADGTVVRWGTTFAGALPFPTGLNGIRAIASSGGAGHALALRTDGTVVGWGSNSSGQATPPAGLDQVVGIATGVTHSLALKTDGTVVAWGSTTGARSLVPRSQPRAVAIAASNGASFALSGTAFGIQDQPDAQTVAIDGSATLRIGATGSGALAYQWRKDGVAIPGATAATYTIARVSAGDAGNYDVIITSGGVAFQSAAARLTAVVPSTTAVSRIANLSIRTRAGAVDESLIVGFVIGGPGTSGNKPLLVRGVGPALVNFGVTDALVDPRVDLFNAASVRVFNNDNWNSADATTFTSVGAFGLPAGSRDAALFQPALAAASYSAHVSGVGGTSGVALAEIYDVTPDVAFGPGTPRLVNVSARAVSGTGDNVLIAGFVIAGPGTKRVLIRAIGPTLQSVFGVGGALPDPKLELFSSAAGKLQENDNWGGTVALTSAFSSVGAFQLGAGTLDSALLATLPPGAYTAQVSGVGGATGVALVEIYDVP